MTTADRVALERHAVWVLGVPTAALFAAYAAVVAYHYRVTEVESWMQAFGVGREHNVPAWWNAVLLLSIAATALLVSVLTPAGRRPSARLWRLAALAMAYLAFDESLSVHERLDVPANALLSAFDLSFPTFVWLLPGSLLAVAGAWLGFRWFAAVPRDVRLGLILGGAVYVTGALAVEAVNGALIAADLYEAYLVGTGLEELLEMAGCIIVVHSLLRIVDVDPESRAMALRPQAVAEDRAAHRSTGRPSRSISA